MDLDFNNLDDIDIDKEGITKSKLNKYIIIIPTISIIISMFIIIASFYYLIKGDYKKEKKEIPKNCIEGDDDLCSRCEDDKCVSCNYKYAFVNGSCIPEFSFKVIYETTEFNETIVIVDNMYKYNIKEIELDKEVIDKSEAEEADFKFILEEPGNHTVYFTFDTEKMDKIMVSLFGSVDKIIYIHFSKNFNTENITQMVGLFFEYKKVKYIDISNFNLEKMTQMDNIFYGCSSLTSVKLPNSSAPFLKSLKYMFTNCESLTSISFSKGMNYSTENLKELEGMFSGCKSLTSINFSYLKTYNISNTIDMFKDCISLTSLDLSNFTTTDLQMDNMFSNCTKLTFLDISNFGIPLSYDNCTRNFPPKGKIRLNKKISEIFKKIVPKTWTFDII